MERDLCDIVREYEENEVEIPRYEVDTCAECNCVFLVARVAPRLAEESLCSWRCWSSLYGEEG